MRLRNITSLLAEYIERLDDAEAELSREERDRLVDEIVGLDETFERKADSFAEVIAETASDIEVLREEEKRLAARRKALESKERRLKEILVHCMGYTGKTKFKTQFHSFSIRSYESIEVTDIEKAPAEFVNTEVVKTVDKRGLLTYIKAVGDLPEGIELKVTPTVIIR